MNLIKEYRFRYGIISYFILVNLLIGPFIFVVSVYSFPSDPGDSMFGLLMTLAYYFLARNQPLKITVYDDRVNILYLKKYMTKKLSRD